MDADAAHQWRRRSSCKSIRPGNILRDLIASEQITSAPDTNISGKIKAKLYC